MKKLLKNYKKLLKEYKLSKDTNLSSLKYATISINKYKKNYNKFPKQKIDLFFFFYKENSFFKIKDNKLKINNGLLCLLNEFYPQFNEIEDVKEYCFQKNINKKILKIMTDCNIHALKKEIDSFIFYREKLFTFEKLPYSLKQYYSEEEQKEILKLIRNLINISGITTVKYTDYYFNTSNIKKETLNFVLPKIHNYKTLKKELINIINNEDEFINSSPELDRLEKRKEEILLKQKQFLNSKTMDDEESLTFKLNKHKLKDFENSLTDIENNKKEIYDSIDILNSLTLFNKEFLTLFCLRLDELVEKENALNKFIDDVINKNI